VTSRHFIVGDVHACLEPLEALLDRVRFDPASDRLWFTGDLIGRGPAPLATLIFIRQLGGCANAVLGNHDINALAIAEGLIADRPDNRLEPLLRAEQKTELLHWLRQRPLLLSLPGVPYTIIHAGLPPMWSLAHTQAQAAWAEQRLQSADYRAALASLYGDSPTRWSEAITADEQLRFTINALTRMRYCSEDGQLLLRAKGAPESAPAGHYPWFATPGHSLDPEQTTIVSGHWSTLGLRRGPGYITLDTGCLWGGCLSMLCIDADADEDESAQVISQQCPEYRAVGG